MKPQEIIEQFPYPIAKVYADLEMPEASLQLKREALHLTCSQLIRTVALPLVGQYFTRDLPDPQPDQSVDSLNKAADSLNKAIVCIKSPSFKNWIDLLNNLTKNRRKLALDFFPEFEGAMATVKSSHVDVPENYGLGYGQNWHGLTWFEAFLALRNFGAHSGSPDNEVCSRDLIRFRPYLDQLLEAFSFLRNYELLVLHSELDAPNDVLVSTLRGSKPQAPVPTKLDEGLSHALEKSPVVMRSPHGKLQGLFPFFHGHLQGEPVGYYDGHDLRDTKPVRRTIIYLGYSERWPLEDAGAQSRITPPATPDAAEKLRQMLERRKIAWQMRRDDVAPWTIHDPACDYARRTLGDLTGVKYLPNIYLDRPALSQPLLDVATKDIPHRAMLLAGRAGTGKTALLCDLTAKLLGREEKSENVFFLRAHGLTIEEEQRGNNLLLANFYKKIGLYPGDFPSFDDFFSAVDSKRKSDQVTDRLFVIILDALNEAEAPRKIFREALDLVSDAQRYPWVRIILSVREEFLDIWREGAVETGKSPFAEIKRYFLPPPEDPENPHRPEDPPAWSVPSFTVAEAQKVYGRYQESKRETSSGSACPTLWEAIPLETSSSLLIQPLYLDLWMRTFNGREAPPVSGPSELFNFYLENMRGEFPGFWPSMQKILDYMLAQGRMELSDDDDRELRTSWEKLHTERELRLRFSPVETVCIAGVMQRRATDEGNAYRIPHQRLAEQLLYVRLREQNEKLTPESLRKWMKLPWTEELEGALAQIAADLWENDRAADVAELFDPESPPLNRCVYRMLISQLDGLARPGDVEAMFRRQLSLIAELSSRGGKAGARSLKFFQELLTPAWQKLGDRQTALGRGKALDSYLQSVEMAEHNNRVEPGRIDLVRELILSYNIVAKEYRKLGNEDMAIDFEMKAVQMGGDLLDADAVNSHVAPQLSQRYKFVAGQYLELGQTEKALDFTLKAIEITEKLTGAQSERCEDACNVVDAITQLVGDHTIEPNTAVPFFKRAHGILYKLEADGALSEPRAVRLLKALELGERETWGKR